MDWTIISIAASAFGVLAFFIGYRFGNTAGFVKGVQYGVNKVEEACKRCHDTQVSFTDSLEKYFSPPPGGKFNLSKEEIEYLHAMIATLDKMISECADPDPEDVVSKMSLEEQRDAIKKIIDQDAKEKANV